jgi:uncharacterized protein (DUF486 family)
MKTNNYIILIIGLIISDIFALLASFSYKYYTKKEKSFLFIFIMSLFFAIFSYTLRIPLFYYYGVEDTLSIYILTTIIVSFLLLINSKYILKENVKPHTYIILMLITLLVIINNYLDIK